VDTVAPDTTLTGGPGEGATASSQSITFGFGSSEGGTFECQLDGTGWTACESPRSYTGLSEGPHTFAVRALDVAGNVDGSPATRTWTVDVPPPPVVTPGEPTVTPAPMGVRSRFRTRVSDGRTTVKLLKLTMLPQAARVKVSCKGKGCAFTSKTLKASSYVVLTKLFKNRKLSAGTVITMQITAAGYEPKVFRYKTRKGSKPPIGGAVARRY
jgi:hypothetical protein